jgi:regulator of protease activity HflC (stomatin/prohibitin superfamily)
VPGAALLLISIDWLSLAGSLLFCAILALLLVAIVGKLTSFETYTVLDFQKAVVVRGGRMQETVETGRHWHLRFFSQVYIFDCRAQSLLPPPQELMTRDGMPAKIAATAEFKVIDPVGATRVANFSEYLAMHLQLAAKDIVSSTTAEQLLHEQNELSGMLMQKLVPHAANAGLELISAELREFFVAVRQD